MPSEMHSELIRRALVWLSNIATQKGMRSCPELTLAEGYVADAGAIMNLQMTWDRKFFNGKYFNSLCSENSWPSVDDFTFVVEAKASRSDFMKTFIKNGHRG